MVSIDIGEKSGDGKKVAEGKEEEVRFAILEMNVSAQKIASACRY